MPIPQYRLSTLLLFVLCLGIVLALCQTFGIAGVFFALPTLAVVFAACELVRRRRAIAAIIVSAIYLILWMVTALYGVPAAESRQRSMVEEFQRSQPYPVLSREEFDSLREAEFDSSRERDWRHQSPWYFIGEGATPCPFMVGIEYGAGGGRHGDRWAGHRYFVWLPGLPLVSFEARSFYRN